MEMIMKQYERNLLIHRNFIRNFIPHKYFTDKEVETVKKYWGKLSATRIGEKLDRTARSISSKGIRLGLPKLANRRRDLGYGVE